MPTRAISEPEATASRQTSYRRKVPTASGQHVEFVRTVSDLRAEVDKGGVRIIKAAPEVAARSRVRRWGWA